MPDLMDDNALAGQPQFAGTLGGILTAMAAHSGTTCLEHLLAELCRCFAVDHALIAIPDSSNPQQMTSLAFCRQGQAAENIHFPLAGSLCAELDGPTPCSFRSRVQQRFPADILLQELQAESFIGIPLPDTATGAPRLLALLHHDSIADDLFVIEICTLLSGRIAAEIGHLQALAIRDGETDRLDREMAAFSYAISHDLRAPLRAIHGFSEALHEDCAAQLDDTAQDYVQRIRNGAQRMSGLIDALLVLSRVTRHQLKHSALDLSQLCMEILQGLRRQTPQRSVQVNIQPDMIAHGDPELLRIALEKLLDNAWKFTALTDDAQIDISMQEQAGETLFQVRDNGAGFNMDYADKLFGLFQRLHNEDAFRGDGMGLATVKRIIERHGGRVEAQGGEAEGACFRFSLPD
ncbi:MAG TPA: hypothetical protein ENJ80_15455 [Gammaproteobacteria bacterium]|nr:hypothetical protein [Gammaproteobacteria bacterium]